jgi:hypothetical protein
MAKRVRNWIVLAVLIGAILAGAYLIVKRNNAAMNSSAGETPSGFMH